MVLKVSVVEKLQYGAYGKLQWKLKNVGPGSLEPSIAENGISKMGPE